MVGDVTDDAMLSFASGERQAGTPQDRCRLWPSAGRVVFLSPGKNALYNQDGSEGEGEPPPSGP